MSSALASMYRIARDLGLRTEHRDGTLEEAEAVAEPGVDDAELTDLCELPFVTIDYETSWDLDQALFVRERDDGYEVFYALADAAHFVRPGSGLFAEAMERGTSFYLPGLVLPMLPEVLSEGVTSLLPREARRAMTFRMDLDREGVVKGTEIIRSKIRSRAKLTYREVQHLLDFPSQSSLRDQPFHRSLELMARVGTLRMQLAERRDVVRYDRVGTRLRLSEDGHRIVVSPEVRNAVQMHNEQISLMCNIEGARFLLAHLDGKNDRSGVFRIHEPPSEDRLDELVAFVDAVVAAHQIPLERWQWRREDGESLADYVARLPSDPATRRLAQAIQRQAMVAARPSFFATEPGPHYGIGAQAYSRFSAPMRELVGVVTQHCAWAHLAGESIADNGLRAETVDESVRVGNRARDLQKRADKMTLQVALDQLFGAELGRGRSERKRWVGTVMGVTASKIYVQLDDPPVEVKLYLGDVERAGRSILHTSDHSQCVVGGRPILVGGAIALDVVGRDDGRWSLEPVD